VNRRNVKFRRFACRFSSDKTPNLGYSRCVNLYKMLLLFVYGTLMDPENNFGAILQKKCRFFGEGSMAGRLFQVDWYPGALYEPASEYRVHGKIFELTASEVLEDIDRYEGVGPEFEEPNEYIRTEVQVACGPIIYPCQVYLYNWTVDKLKWLPDGRFG
jgi:gamma-glutamylcyclotransferase (GGCT)/AIG2-like uncharacterized protein YtfP